jgi:predicted PurR-regulated permease PerM
MDGHHVPRPGRDLTMATAQRQNAMAIAAGAVVLLAGLHFAKPVLMPLAIATLLSVVLAPVVKRVERLGASRIVAVVLVMLLATGAVAAATWVVVGQVGQVISLLPNYRQNLQKKLSSLHDSLGGFERTARRIQQLEEELATSATPEAKRDAPPVQVVQTARRPLEVVRDLLGPLAGPLGTLGLVIVLIVFTLIQLEDLRDRLIRVLGSRDLMVTTSAMDDVSRRISRYLRAYSTLNFGHGLLIASGLWLIGLPAALLFGVISALLRFVPYVGPWIAALLPTALSLAVFDDWSHTLMVIGYLATVELVSNNVFEPWLYGASVGLSPYAIIIAAMFWTALWGSVGLVLAIPLTVCMVSLGRYVPQLRFLVVLLGEEPALAPPVRLFQRLLARDVDEADDLVETECAEHGVEHAFDTLLLPALALVDYERRLGRLEEDQIDAARETFDVLAATVEQCATAHGEGGAPPDAAQKSLLCLPAGAFGDEIVCSLAARILTHRGLHVRACPRVLTGEMTKIIAEQKPTLILLSALPPTEGRAIRYLCRRLLRDSPDLQFVVGMWGADEEIAEVRRELEADPVRVVSEFDEACRLVEERLRPAANDDGTNEAPADTGADDAGDKRVRPFSRKPKQPAARPARSARSPERR